MPITFVYNLFRIQCHQQFVNFTFSGFQKRPINYFNLIHLFIYLICFANIMIINYLNMTYTRTNTNNNRHKKNIHKNRYRRQKTGAPQQLRTNYCGLCCMPWPEITDIINILIPCEFAYYFKHGVICNSKLYYATLLIANCVGKVGHLQFAFVVGSKTKSTNILNVLLD